MDRARPCVLLADDEPDLLDLLRRALACEGYNVLVASSGEEALALAQKHCPDVIVLDVVMPGLDGLEICRRLRRDPILARVPVLFLTVRSKLDERLEGWDSGCDDYLTKPFDLNELAAHLRALLRRSGSTAGEYGAAAEPDHVLKVGSLALDLNRRCVSTGDHRVQLTQTEFELLRYLMEHPDQVFASRDLFTEVWGYPSGETSTAVVRWHIMNLRAKIEPDRRNPTYIQTLPGQGFILRRDTGPEL